MDPNSFHQAFRQCTVHFGKGVRSHRAWTLMANQPRWVTVLAVLATVTFIVVPILLLTLAALLVGAVVALVLGTCAALYRSIVDLFSRAPRPASPTRSRKRPDADGRENVRVIR